MSISVFLSSTAKDLAEYREAAHRAIEGMDGYHCVRMETFGARAWNTSDFCRKKVGECELFVGIIGHLHGSSPTGSQKSYTEQEYLAALDYDKPRLMFLAPKNFDVPNDLIDEELESDPNKRVRQKEFRKRVSADQICDTFTSPDDLAGRIRQAVHNWEQEQGKDQTPNLGPFVPHTCDRIDQEANFRKFFSTYLKQCPGFPQIYIIPGEERESHGSLVERFRSTRIQEYANYKWGEQKATVSLWELDWADLGDLSSRQERLKSLLFEKLDPYSPYKKDYDYSATTLRSLLSSSLNSVIIIQHDLATRNWDRTTIQLIDWYLEFWDEIKGDAAIPQCLLFLNIVYPYFPKGSMWRPWRSLRRAYQRFLSRRIQAQLAALCQAQVRSAVQSSEEMRSSCVMLDELSCVKPAEVMNWFRRNKIGDDELYREEKCREIFLTDRGKQSDCKNMVEIEHHLNKIHRSSVRRRVGV